jgi:hypothetical protein
MRNGRINERNTGLHKLDGGAKRSKPETMSVLTEEQCRAKDAVHYCNMLLSDGVRLHDNIPELVSHWITKGIAVIKEVQNPWSYARQFNPTVKIASLNESRRADVELVRDILIQFHKL